MVGARAGLVSDPNEPAQQPTGRPTAVSNLRLTNHRLKRSPLVVPLAQAEVLARAQGLGTEGVSG